MQFNKLLTVALMSLTLNGVANAAKFQSTKTVKSTSLTTLLDAWKNVTEGMEDAGWSAAKITEKKPSEAWINTVKQFLYKTGAEEASAKQVSLSSLNAWNEIKALTEQNYFLHESLLEEDDLRLPLVEALEAINGNKLIFVGAVSGNTFSYNHLTIVDVTRKEIISFYAGTSD